MLRRPSQRRSSRGIQEIDLPLVPILDAFVTLIAFLLLATSLLAVTLIDTPVPVVSADSPKDENKKPLALTLRIDQDTLILSSAFRLIPEQKFPKVDKGYDVVKLHEALLAIRAKFPQEQSIVFMPAADVKYDDLVQLMDASRLLSKTDPAMPTVKDKDGVDRIQQFLFPTVVFGNVISGT
ncbi:MAG: biopolymer transporter ExbD [Bdellovibrionota bacterium]